MLRKISLGKASEIMDMERVRFLGLLDAMNPGYSYLEDQDIDIDKEMVKSAVFDSSPRKFLSKTIRLSYFLMNVPIGFNVIGNLRDVPL